MWIMGIQLLKWIMGICVGIKGDGKEGLLLYFMYNMISWKPVLHAKCIHEQWVMISKTQTETNLYECEKELTSEWTRAWNL